MVIMREVNLLEKRLAGQAFAPSAAISARRCSEHAVAIDNSIEETSNDHRTGLPRAASAVQAASIAICAKP
jgi:hypothetical protein